MAVLSRGLLAAFVVLIASACGGSTSDDATPASTTVVESTSAPEETTSTTSTTAAPTTTAETTTEAPATTESTTTTVAESTDDIAVVEYCMALDDIDAFFESDFPDDADLQAVIDEQQANIEAIVVPSDTLEKAHESYAGALLEFYDTFESNGFDISDAEVEDIFNALNVRLAEGIIELYRENNCDGFEAPADDTADGEDEFEVALTGFDFAIGKCVDRQGSEFEERPCDEPHDFQVYSAFQYDEGLDFPGAGVVEQDAETFCIDAFEGFVGSSYESSIYFVTTLRPSQSSWRQGDQEIVCLLQAETGQLTKDLQGAAE